VAHRGLIPFWDAMIAIGLGYTIFSGMLKIEVAKAWAYREIMRFIPSLGPIPHSGLQMGSFIPIVSLFGGRCAGPHAQLGLIKESTCIGAREGGQPSIKSGNHRFLLSNI